MKIIFIKVNTGEPVSELGSEGVKVHYHHSDESFDYYQVATSDEVEEKDLEGLLGFPIEETREYRDA